MKKIVIVMVAILIIIAAVFTGCFKTNNLEENKITAPTPNNLEVYGTWMVTAEYKINSNNKLEKINNEKTAIINISKQQAIFGDIDIDNPGFKFKRVNEKEYLPKEFASVITGIPSTDGYINIETISDNTNVYLDFILKNQNEGYIYALGELVAIKRIESNANTESTTNQNQEVQAKSSGILLGIKSPAVIEDNKVIKNAGYKTYWISMNNGKLEPIKILDGLLLPRANGTFSNINVINTNTNNKSMQDLKITNYNKNGTKTVQNNTVPTNENREITFAAKDYLGLEYYNTTKNDTNYCITTIDNINSNQTLDIKSLFGDDGQKQYEDSRERLVNSTPNFVIDKYDTSTLTPSQITMIRKNGKWVVDGILDSKITGVNDLDFEIPISPIGKLVNYDKLPVSWNKVKQVNTNAIDAFASPTGNFIVILDKNSIKIYGIKNGQIEKEPIKNISIEVGETPVMAEWAVGDFVSVWNKVIDEKKN
ncbi:MAG: hypothetical protein ACRC57_07920 [Sarcina sp.]